MKCSFFSSVPTIPAFTIRCETLSSSVPLRREPLSAVCGRRGLLSRQGRVCPRRGAAADLSPPPYPGESDGLVQSPNSLCQGLWASLGAGDAGEGLGSLALHPVSPLWIGPTRTTMRALLTCVSGNHNCNYRASGERHGVQMGDSYSCGYHLRRDEWPRRALVICISGSHLGSYCVSGEHSRVYIADKCCGAYHLRSHLYGNFPSLPHTLGGGGLCCAIHCKTSDVVQHLYAIPNPYNHGHARPLRWTAFARGHGK